VNFQVWQITTGSLITNSSDLGIKFVETFGTLREAREFLRSDSFLATYVKDRGLTLAQFLIIPESNMFVLIPARLDPCICIADLDPLADPEDPT